MASVGSMIIERDVAITADDGLELRADVFRPENSLPVPAILSLGPYGKGVEYKEKFKFNWDWMLKLHPDILPNSTKSFMTWETVDPETWTSWGYAVVRIDARGTGRTPGMLDFFSPREIKDFYDAIEWTGVQSWCNGKVGLCGISYHAITQWLVAALQPPHLAAMIPWEGAADFYRDNIRHGGIVSNIFLQGWYNRQVLPNQHGNPEGLLDPWTGQRATGPAQFTEEELRANRNDPFDSIIDHRLDDEFCRSRSADWSKVKVPFLSAANVGGFGLHARGNFEAFSRAASSQKWLDIHPGRHEEWFYLDKPMAMQKRFFDHFLKGESNDWDHESRVQVHLRRPFSSEFEFRNETEWPLAGTEWTKTYLSAENQRLSWASIPEDQTVSFDAAGQPLTFTSVPLEEETELTGPLAAKLFVSSTTEDADLFLTLQAFAPDGREVDFQGSLDPRTPLAQGWLRASHRKLDPTLSKAYRPYHAHDEVQPLVPGQIYELDVEIWPTSIILPAGFTIALQISGHDFEREGPSHTDHGRIFKGSGPFLHTHPKDRGVPTFKGTTTVHTGKDTPSYLLLPIIKGGK